MNTELLCLLEATLDYLSVPEEAEALIERGPAKKPATKVKISPKGSPKIRSKPDAGALKGRYQDRLKAAQARLAKARTDKSKAKAQSAAQFWAKRLAKKHHGSTAPAMKAKVATDVVRAPPAKATELKSLANDMRTQMIGNVAKNTAQTAAQSMGIDAKESPGLLKRLERMIAQMFSPLLGSPKPSKQAGTGTSVAVQDALSTVRSTYPHIG